MAGVDGIEPSHVGVKVRCLTAWLHPCVVGWVMGIEPMHNGATIRRVNRFTIPTTGYLFCLALSCLTTIFSISVNVFRVNHFLKTFLTQYRISPTFTHDLYHCVPLMFLQYIKHFISCKPPFLFFTQSLFNISWCPIFSIAIYLFLKYIGALLLSYKSSIYT